MGFLIEVNGHGHLLEMSDIETSHHYLENHIALTSLRQYLIPPHEPVPELPSLTERGRELLASEAGRKIVSGWFDAFSNTFENLDAFHALLKAGPTSVEDISKASLAHSLAIHALGSRLNHKVAKPLLSK